MQRAIHTRALTVDGYVELLHQLRQQQRSPRSPLSVGAAIIRARHPADECWTTHLDEASTIVRTMTTLDRLDPVGLGPQARERIAFGSGRPLREIDRLIHHFEEMREALRLYEQSRLWERLKLLWRLDPILSRIARGSS